MTSSSHTWFTIGDASYLFVSAHTSLQAVFNTALGDPSEAYSRLCTSSAPNSSRAQNSSAQEKLKFCYDLLQGPHGQPPLLFSSFIAARVIPQFQLPSFLTDFRTHGNSTLGPLARSCPLPGTVCLWIPAPVLESFPWCHLLLQRLTLKCTLSPHFSPPPFSASLFCCAQNYWQGLPWCSVVKNPTCCAGGHGLILGPWKIPHAAGTKPLRHNYWAWALEPKSYNY